MNTVAAGGAFVRLRCVPLSDRRVCAKFRDTFPHVSHLVMCSPVAALYLLDVTS